MNRYGVIEAFEEGVNPAEYVVDGSTFAPVVPPSLDHSLVVAVNPKVSARTNKPGEGSNKQFKADRLCPSDVFGAVEILPAWNESPSSPSLADDDGNTDA